MPKENMTTSKAPQIEKGKGKKPEDSKVRPELSVASGSPDSGDKKPHSVDHAKFNTFSAKAEDYATRTQALQKSAAEAFKNKTPLAKDPKYRIESSVLPILAKDTADLRDLYAIDKRSEELTPLAYNKAYDMAEEFKNSKTLVDKLEKRIAKNEKLLERELKKIALAEAKAAVYEATPKIHAEDESTVLSDRGDLNIPSKITKEQAAEQSIGMATEPQGDFGAQNERIVAQMNDLDTRIDEMQSGASGVFKRMFSGKLRALKHQREDLAQQAWETAPKQAEVGSQAKRDLKKSMRPSADLSVTPTGRTVELPSEEAELKPGKMSEAEIKAQEQKYEDDIRGGVSAKGRARKNLRARSAFIEDEIPANPDLPTSGAEVEEPAKKPGFFKKLFGGGKEKPGKMSEAEIKAQEQKYEDDIRGGVSAKGRARKNLRAKGAFIEDEIPANPELPTSSDVMEDEPMKPGKMSEKEIREQEAAYEAIQDKAIPEYEDLPKTADAGKRLARTKARGAKAKSTQQNIGRSTRL